MLKEARDDARLGNSSNDLQFAAAPRAPALARQEPDGGDFFGNRTRSVNAIFARGTQLSEHLLLEERLLEVADN